MQPLISKPSLFPSRHLSSRRLLSRLRSALAALPAVLILTGPLTLSGCNQPAGTPAAMITSTSPPAPRTVTVTANAEIKTAPDEFVVSVGVDSFAPEAPAAKSANDRIMRALIDATESYKIDPKDVRTENFSLQPRVEGTWDSRRLVGFDAKKTLVIVLRDSERVESLLTELFKAGANRLDSITVGSTKIIEQRKEARAMAMDAAKEKATAMAASLGQKLGRPLKIDERDQSGGWGYRPVNFAGNAMVNNDTQAMVGETMATGKIKIQANVEVTFELAE
jgi:uncharacterized protein